MARDKGCPNPRDLCRRAQPCAVESGLGLSDSESAEFVSKAADDREAHWGFAGIAQW